MTSSPTSVPQTVRKLDVKDDTDFSIDSREVTGNEGPWLVVFGIKQIYLVAIHFAF